jgi:hypothetical protein
MGSNSNISKKVHTLWPSHVRVSKSFRLHHNNKKMIQYVARIPSLGRPEQYRPRWFAVPPRQIARAGSNSTRQPSLTGRPPALQLVAAEALFYFSAFRLLIQRILRFCFLLRVLPFRLASSSRPLLVPPLSPLACSRLAGARWLTRDGARRPSAPRGSRRRRGRGERVHRRPRRPRTRRRERGTRSRRRSRRSGRRCGSLSRVRVAA